MTQHNKAALVTGGARRVGKALALRLAQRGYDIALHFNSSSSDAQETKNEIEKKGRHCHLFQTNLMEDEALEHLLPSVIERLPGLNLLVNNASIWKEGNFLNSTKEELDEYLRIHVEVPYLLTRDFAKLARKGLVINVIDSNIVKHSSRYFAYLLSKKALYDFTLLAASELAPEIRVNAIAPGAVQAPEDERKEEYESKFSQNPLNRPGSADDVADALEFLINSEHISGQCIFVSGGKHLT